eukprot:180255-Chlamydomonas_euryale.AAC.2
MLRAEAFRQLYLLTSFCSWEGYQHQPSPPLPGVSAPRACLPHCTLPGMPQPRQPLPPRHMRYSTRLQPARCQPPPLRMHVPGACACGCTQEHTAEPAGVRVAAAAHGGRRAQRPHATRAHRAKKGFHAGSQPALAAAGGHRAAPVFGRGGQQRRRQLRRTGRSTNALPQVLLRDVDGRRGVRVGAADATRRAAVSKVFHSAAWSYILVCRASCTDPSVEPLVLLALPILSRACQMCCCWGLRVATSCWEIGGQRAVGGFEGQHAVGGCEGPTSGWGL